MKFAPWGRRPARADLRASEGVEVHRRVGLVQVRDVLVDQAGGGLEGGVVDWLPGHRVDGGGRCGVEELEVLGDGVLGHGEGLEVEGG